MEELENENLGRNIFHVAKCPRASHTLNLKKPLQVGNCKVWEAIQKNLQIGPNSKSESGLANLLKVCSFIQVSQCLTPDFEMSDMLDDVVVTGAKKESSHWLRPI